MAQQTCPWCETDIIWDEELGPEKYCPHCENELSGYRTMELDELIEVRQDEEPYEQDDWDDDRESSILRSTRELAANSVVQKLIDEQLEAPECTNCREYMLEAGTQTVGGSQDFQKTDNKVTSKPIINVPFKLIWYVCPSCYRTDSYLSLHDRKHMLDALTPENDND